MKKLRLLKIMGSVMIIILFLASCEAFSPEEPSQEVIETAAAETQIAVQTETAVAEVEQKAQEVAQTQTAFAELEPEPTDTPEPTPTRTEEQTDPVADRCHWAGFVRDITIEDSTILNPRQVFTKIWRLENIGTCTWNTNFQVSFESGNQMGAPATSSLPQAVEPGETVDISIDMTAPASPGTYTGYWMLVSETGEVFGLGDDASSPFWVRIRVTEEDEYVVYNLAENYCQAGWRSSAVDPIHCPSEEDLEMGFVQAVDQPRLEDGKVYHQPAILTYPDFGESGYMVGRYPPLLIEEGDSFRATIGCLHNATSCNVNFTLRVLEPGVGFHTLGMWHEIYDGLIYPIDVDLSEFAGMEVELTLSAIAVDDTKDNYALWVDPRVVRGTDPDTPYNRARFIDDITIEDSTVLDPEQPFTKTWRIRNVGTNNWDAGYKVIFSSGNQMGAPSSVTLPHIVEPGDSVDISIDMTAPASPGTYTGYWMLVSDTGEVFGLGDDASSPFWVRIRVTEEDEFLVYNLAENYCQAGWLSRVVDPIQCPSDEDLRAGFVQSVDQPRLEDGKVYDQPAILTYPNFGESGYMVGRYPPLLIEEGDSFRATIGCLHNATSCNVNYTLRVLEPGIGFHTLGMWHEVYDGLIYPIDVDLSEFAGMEVELTLSVIAVDDSMDNFALWIDPRVVREAD